ncbi:hypothetical protein [Clostridium sp.]|uniref:hypothetical protein n=1 Tax=Clostridium sp. TaxID=1506 RepID=UPI0026331CB3|nr:hypothetical protein [Clostridium sp.]
MVLKAIQRLKEQYSNYDFKVILNIVENDIRFNRISFGKKTSQSKFLEILNEAEMLVRKV